MIGRIYFLLALGMILFAGLLSAIGKPKHGQFYEQMKIAVAKTDSECASIESTLTVPDIEFLIRGEKELLQMQLLANKLRIILAKNRLEFEKQYYKQIKELTQHDLETLDKILQELKGEK